MQYSTLKIGANNLIRLLLIISCLSLASISNAQDEKAKGLYKEKDYIKCVKRCQSLLESDKSNISALYYQSISYFAMSLQKSKYSEFTQKPLEECLESLVLLRKTGDTAFWVEHAASFEKIRGYAEDYAAKKVKNNQTTTATKVYKNLLIIFKPNYSELDEMNIAFKVGDYTKAYQQVSNYYSISKPDAKPTDDAKRWAIMTGAPLLLAENHMFVNLMDLLDAHYVKFAGNPALAASLTKAATAALDTLFQRDGKNDFFLFAKDASKTMKDNPEFQAYLQKTTENLIRDTRKRYDLTAKPRTWKDSIHLRNYFKYIDKADQILTVGMLDGFKKAGIEAYRPGLPPTAMKAFKNAACKVFNQYRSEPHTCKDEMYPPIDSIKWSNELYQAAAMHAENMFIYNYTNHDDMYGRTPKDRVDMTDLKEFQLMTMGGLFYVGAVKVHESISWGFALEQDFSQANIEKQVAALMKKWLAEEIDCKGLSDLEHTNFALANYGDRWVLLAAKVLIYDNKQ